MRGMDAGRAQAFATELLDIPATPAQKQSRVLHVSPTTYFHWRARSSLAAALHDDPESPPEALLQMIWQHQRLQRDQLLTLDGQPVRVLHPGFRSLEGGPDFRAAVVSIGGAPAVSGDIEVDLRPNGWKAHGHDRNPAFSRVILHVVWDGGGVVANEPPRLALRHALDAPVGELGFLLAGQGELLAEAARGWCCEPLRSLSPRQRQELLRQAARTRLESKAAQFQARARQAGWEQALWEGLFRALGYKHNVWPMLLLAEHRSRWLAPAAGLLGLQARLFGISGLLPPEPGRDGDGQYLRRHWDAWWREREEFSDCVLPRQVWRLHGVRPVNHPARRLALAAHWAIRGDLTKKLEAWCVGSHPAAALPDSLLSCLQAEPDPFWTRHYNFTSRTLPADQPLLGAARATDLAMNVILPWLWVRAAEGGNAELRRELESRYFQWPPAQDNSVLKLARQRLLGTAASTGLTTAADQQGLVQIVRDFCERSDSVCAGCRMPELVKELCLESANPESPKTPETAVP